MTPQQVFMKKLEERDYNALKVPSQFLHFVKMRDKLAYYSLQLQPFFRTAPWDLPVIVDGRRFGSADIMALQFAGLTSIEFFDLLSDIEIALIEAAARRGITLHGRPKLDDEGAFGSGPQRSRTGKGSALGE